GGDAPGATEPADALRPRYPGGSHTAEALRVHPGSGDLYIVGKGPNPGVYGARAPLQGRSTVTMEKVTNLAVGDDSRILVTGGDIAPDGTRLALSTYGEGYELRLPAGSADFDAIWAQPPQPLTLRLRPQGESIAYRLHGNA